MNKNLVMKNRAEDGEDDGQGWTPFGQPQAKVSKRTSPSHHFTLYLDEGIREPAYYRDHIDTLNNAQEGDLVTILINSPGGRIDSACAIISAIENCDGDVIAVLMGDTHSAASMIALACSGIQVSPYASMLVHQASFGSFGSASIVYDQVDFYRRNLDKLMKKFYKNFLTEQELKEVQAGKEMWLDADEIGDRLKVLFEVRSDEVRGQIAEMEAELAGLKEEAGELETFEVAETPQKKVAAKKVPRKRATKAKQ